MFIQNFVKQIAIIIGNKLFACGNYLLPTTHFLVLGHEDKYVKLQN